MHNDPWSGARVPDSGDACDLWDYFRNMAADMAPELEPYFSTTAARDTALTNWVNAGNTTRDGLRCYVQGVGAQRYLSGTWVSAATSGLLTLTSGWGPYPLYHGPYWYLDSDGWVTLSGVVERTGATFSLGTTSQFQFATLPAALAPAASVAPLCYVGLGSSPIGTFPARLYVPPGSTALSVWGMDSGSGTMTSGQGYISLDGVRFHV